MDQLVLPRARPEVLERRFPVLPQIRLCLKAEEMRFGSEATEAMVCAF